MRHRWASLISGSGTTMQAIAKAIQEKKLAMDIACIIASTQFAGGIEKARKIGVSEKDILVIDPNGFKKTDGVVDQEKFGNRMLEELEKRKVSVITQNGWLPLTPKKVIERYHDLIFNQHPGPLPLFGGKGMFGRRVHAARLLFVRLTKHDYWTEVLIQRVGVEFDSGVIVKRMRSDILPSDTVDELKERLKPIEHALQIELLKDVIQGNVREEMTNTMDLLPGEEHQLKLCKNIAIVLYPEG